MLAWQESRNVSPTTNHVRCQQASTGTSVVLVEVLVAETQKRFESHLWGAQVHKTIPATAANIMANIKGQYLKAKNDNLLS